MTPLAALLDALRTDSTLAWLLVHAGDGDRDAAVRRAWEGETRPETIIRCTHDGAVAWWQFGSGDGCVCDPGALWKCECPACCTAIRDACDCPTWAELTRAA